MFRASALRSFGRKRLAPLVLGSSLALSPLAPAWAQGLNSAEVWAAWQAAVSDAGGSLRARESRDGNHLVLEDVTLTSERGGRGFALSLQKITLVGQADGSVAVKLPDSFELRVRDPAPMKGLARTAVFTISAPELQLSIMGLGKRREFQAIGPSLSLALDRFEPPLPADDRIDIVLALADIGLFYKHDLTDGTARVDAALNLGSAHGTLDAYEKSSIRDESVRASADLSALAFEMKVTVPPSMEGGGKALSPEREPSLGEMLAAVNEGLAVHLSMKLGPSRLDAVQDNGTLALEARSSHAGFGLDKTLLSYTSSLHGITLSARNSGPTGGPGMTIVDRPEINVRLGEYTQGMSAGLADFSRPRQWSLSYALRQLELDDATWREIGLADALPRTPLTFALNLDGTYGLDPALLHVGPDEVPKALNALSFNIREFALNGFGVDVAGKGGLSFDFSDQISFGGIPAPSGRVGFSIKGANALLDKLAELNLIDQESLKSVRLALIFATRAGDTPDILTTDLDFRDKSFYLNGQKIR